MSLRVWVDFSVESTEGDKENGYITHTLMDWIEGLEEGEKAEFGADVLCYDDNDRTCPGKIVRIENGRLVTIMYDDEKKSW